MFRFITWVAIGFGSGSLFAGFFITPYAFIGAVIGVLVAVGASSMEMSDDHS
jgi:hypothetical protein